VAAWLPLTNQGKFVADQLEPALSQRVRRC
jgi:hypothetical protein